MGKYTRAPRPTMPYTRAVCDSSARCFWSLFMEKMEYLIRLLRDYDHLFKKKRSQEKRKHARRKAVYALMVCLSFWCIWCIECNVCTPKRAKKSGGETKKPWEPGGRGLHSIHQYTRRNRPWQHGLDSNAVLCLSLPALYVVS